MAKNKKINKIFSALEVAKICGVVNQTAINWIRSGYLKAFTTPGGQYRVYVDDLLSFMKERSMKIPAELLAFSNNKVMKVLVVDDDRGLNTVITKFLEKNIENLQLFQAFDGFEAGALMIQEKPACLILDLDLPGIDGLCLCEKISRNAYDCKPYIIVVTALEDEEIEEKVKKVGGSVFFRKPLNLVTVCSAVKNLL
ncbi:MAG: response regulator [Spirochaetaceae bacterium]|nr:response regulator [Spirochaetaceae bacterium]